MKASSVSLAGGVVLSEASCVGGGVEFQRAAIGGGVHATGATLSNPSGATLLLHHATVRGSVRLVDGFASEGYVLLSTIFLLAFTRLARTL